MNCDRNLYYESPAYVYEILKEELEKISSKWIIKKYGKERLLKIFQQSFNIIKYSNKIKTTT